MRGILLAPESLNFRQLIIGFGVDGHNYCLYIGL